MWYVTAALAVAGGISSARQERKAGQVALRDARAQAAEIRRQKFDVSLISGQQHQDLLEQFKDLSDVNDAITAMTGRTGRSVSALRKRESSKYGRDVDRLRSQEQREKDALESEAKATETRGESARKAYRASSRTTLFDTAYKTSTLIPSKD